jgi:protein phosphatase
MSLILRSTALSDPGLVRTNNEDAAYAGVRLLAVADGIGGLPAGELASDIVIRALAGLDVGPDPEDPLTALLDTLAAANDEIRETAVAEEGRDGMGTTVTALLRSGDAFVLLHVGDSRGYLFRDGGFTQLTKDDTFVQSLVDLGVLTPDEARRHPQRSLVTQAVQGGEFQPTTGMIEMAAGDRYLLCSDGLSDYVATDGIMFALRSYPDPEGCAEALVKLALEAGAPDNVTVVIADTTAG